MSTSRNLRLNIAVPVAVLAGGERSVIAVEASVLLSFFHMKGAMVLRAVSSELRDAIAAFTWNDESSFDGNRVVQWRACFPNARTANLCDTTVQAEAFVLLRDLVSLDLTDSCFPVEAFVDEHYPRLNNLNLQGCSDLTGDDLGDLQCPLLTNLDLTYCEHLTGAGLVALKCPQITSLNLSCCSGITDTGLIGLQCPMLTSLNLRGCSGITDAGLIGLQCPMLTSLSLWGCSGITDAGLAGLQCPVLTTLDLTCCSGITSAGLAGLQCPMLTSLDLEGCSGITDAGLEGNAQEKLRYARELNVNV